VGRLLSNRGRSEKGVVALNKMQMTSLANKTVVISGGATGIGLALALEFVSHGAIVVIGSRRQSAIDEAIKASDGKLHGKKLDVVDRLGVNEFMA